MKAIVLAAAKSEKLLPFVKSRPKSMIPIAGCYILQTILQQIKSAGIHEVWIVVNHKREIIQEHFQYGKSIGLKLDYIVQSEESGIGNAVALCEQNINDDHFMLVYGDALMTGNPFENLLQVFERGNRQSIATISHPSSEGAYGNVYLSHDMTISRFIEKPKDSRLSNYIFGGSFILRRSCFQFLKNNNYDMVALYQDLITQKHLEASLWEDQWMDLSRPWHILLANQMMMAPWNASHIPSSVQIEQNVSISGVVKFGENVKVKSGTTIVGPCYIGSDVYIGNSTLIRENASIGTGTVIGYGTEIKNAVLFGNSNIGRLSFIGDSVFGDNVQIGSGTMTLNHDINQNKILLLQTNTPPLETNLPKLGSFVGDNSIIGAGNTIAPGTVIPAETKLLDNITISDETIKNLL